MLATMRPGSVVVDLAAETGGNCEATRTDETITINNMTVIGAVNLPATLPLHASLFTFSGVNVTALTIDGSDQQTSSAGPTTASISRTGERTLFDPLNLMRPVGTATATSAASARAGAGTLGVQTAVTIHAAGSPTSLKAGAQV
jgi:hypothetical protein